MGVGAVYYRKAERPASMLSPICYSAGLCRKEQRPPRKWGRIEEEKKAKGEKSSHEAFRGWQMLGGSHMMNILRYKSSLRRLVNNEIKQPTLFSKMTETARVQEELSKIYVRG